MKLPIGIQTFSQIREEDFIYIDKTQEAFDLIEKYKYVFLSRPRRFGKSLFLDTLYCIFEGKKELFKGLYIEDKYDFSISYPVIRMSFSGKLTTKEGIKDTFDDICSYNEDRLGIDKTDVQTPASRLKSIILQVHKKYQQKVVILVDEYDKPLLDNITNPEMAKYAKDELRSFYSVIKDHDNYIRFTFLTGVSKFSKMSIFSGLNNLQDISLNANYGNICGYTQKDIETTFKPLLEGVDLAELKIWYNGYHFLKDDVYNPFDILLFIDGNHEYQNYWFETGTPTFLLNLIKEQHSYLPRLENIKLNASLINSFDVNNLDLFVILFQSGYLTIDKKIASPRGGVSYILKIPNKEVRLSLSDSIMDMILAHKKDRRFDLQDAIYYALEDTDFTQIETVLRSLFAALPYESYAHGEIASYEGYYSNIIYVFFSSLGFPITVEDSVNTGRLDMSLLINNQRYVLEFKVKDSKDPTAQIKEKKYYEKYLNEGSNIHLIGIRFDEEARNISSFQYESLTI